jgi:hypothetical protein
VIVAYAPSGVSTSAETIPELHDLLRSHRADAVSSAEAHLGTRAETGVQPGMTPSWAKEVCGVPVDPGPDGLSLSNLRDRAAMGLRPPLRWWNALQVAVVVFPSPCSA